MIKGTIPNQSKPKSLTAQIRDAERELLNRQQRVGVRADTLVRKIHQQLTAPSTLLLAGGIGFIIGEITKRQPPKIHGDAGTTPITSALNLITSVHTLYRALPLVWLMKSFRQPGSTSGQTPEGRFHTQAKAPHR